MPDNLYLTSRTVYPRGAFVLGYDLGQQASAQEKQKLEAILQALLQPPDYLMLSRLAARSLSEREQRVFLEVTVRRFEALGLGLRLASS